MAALRGGLALLLLAPLQVAHYVEIEGARTFLEPLAEATGGHGWSARRPDALRGAFVEALEEFKSRYRLRYEPSGVPRAGWHELEVRLVGRKGKVRARPGYLVLHQGYGNHARAFEYYAAALGMRPGDPSALLARATALEFSVLPDGFGAVVVADGDVWRLLEPGREPPRELAYELANPRSEAPYRRLLLEFLTRQYHDVLELDPGRTEAGLRLGRVLEARGIRAEAGAELRAVAAGGGDSFLLAVARLCLARFDPSPEASAAAYRSALEVDSGLRPAWLGLSQVLHASGDREGAVATVERALSPEGPRPLDAWVEYHLGRGRAFRPSLAALRARIASAD